jgi:hypothetical protein
MRRAGGFAAILRVLPKVGLSASFANAAAMKKRGLFFILPVGLAFAGPAFAIDCSVGGCKICEKLMCGDPSRAELVYKGRTVTETTYYTCNDGVERTTVEFCSAACMFTSYLPSGSPVPYAVSNALAGGSCNSSNGAIVVSGGSSCPTDYFELPACAKSTGSDGRGTYKYICN